MKSLFHRVLILLILAFMPALRLSAKEVIVTSPDGKAVIRLDYSKGLLLSVDNNNYQVMAASLVSMSIKEHPEAFVNPTRPKIKTREVRSVIIPPVA